MSFLARSSWLLLSLSLLAVPAPAQRPDDAEKALRAEFKKALGSKEASARAAAVAAYGNATRDLPDAGGAAKLVAQTLALALADEDPSVGQAAVEQLAWGRDPATVIDTLGEALGGWRTGLEALATRPDDASRDLYSATQAAYARGVAALGRYADDRATKVLEDELRVLKPEGELENLARDVVGEVCTALLALGSERAVESVVKATATFPASTVGGTSDVEKSRLGMANSVHNALAEYSRRLEIPPPDFGQNYQQAWAEWFKANKKRFAPKLGKLETPPAAPAERKSDADAGRASGGRSRP